MLHFSCQASLYNLVKSHQYCFSLSRITKSSGCSATLSECTNCLAVGLEPWIIHPGKLPGFQARYPWEQACKQGTKAANLAPKLIFRGNLSLCMEAPFSFYDHPQTDRPLLLLPQDFIYSPLKLSKSLVMATSSDTKCDKVFSFVFTKSIAQVSMEWQSAGSHAVLLGYRKRV